MVFCPFDVYIDEKGKLRKSLFKNFKKLLHKDGVIITTIANKKIALLKNYIKKPQMKNIEKLIRKIIDMLAFKLNLRLLIIEENKKYIIKKSELSL